MELGRRQPRRGSFGYNPSLPNLRVLDRRTAAKAYARLKGVVVKKNTELNKHLRLQLHRETLRALEHPELVVGGYPLTYATCSSCGPYCSLQIACRPTATAIC